MFDVNKKNTDFIMINVVGKVDAVWNRKNPKLKSQRHHFSLTCMENLIPIKPTQNIQSTWL